MAKKKTEINEASEAAGEQQQEPSIVESIVETVSTATSDVVEAVANVVEGTVEALGFSSAAATTQKADEKVARRAQKVGTVSSDKMTKTVVVNVDRKVMHPKYRRYVRRTSKFMAHDEMEAVIGDKVRIEETRPMSARKRWRVIEIIQKAAK